MYTTLFCQIIFVAGSACLCFMFFVTLSLIYNQFSLTLQTVVHDVQSFDGSCKV